MGMLRKRQLWRRTLYKDMSVEENQPDDEEEGGLKISRNRPAVTTEDRHR